MSCCFAALAGLAENEAAQGTTQQATDGDRVAAPDRTQGFLDGFLAVLQFLGLQRQLARLHLVSSRAALSWDRQACVVNRISVYPGSPIAVKDFFRRESIESCCQALSESFAKGSPGPRERCRGHLQDRLGLRRCPASLPMAKLHRVAGDLW